MTHFQDYFDRDLYLSWNFNTKWPILGVHTVQYIQRSFSLSISKTMLQGD